LRVPLNRGRIAASEVADFRRFGGRTGPRHKSAIGREGPSITAQENKE